MVFDFFLEKKSPLKKGNTVEIKKETGQCLSVASQGDEVKVPEVFERADCADLAKTPAVILEARRQCGKRSRYFPVKVKQSLFKRSKGCCEYVSPEGVRCQSRYKVQIDHLMPFSQGGANTYENARHLCENHNQMKATEQGIGFETTSYFPMAFR